MSRSDRELTDEEGGVAIDVHAHLIPRLVAKEMNRTPRMFPHIEAQPAGQNSWSFRFGSELPSPLPPSSIFDTETRAEWLADQGISLQIVSPWTDLFGYSLSPSEGTDWCRFLNEATLEETRDRNELFALASVPLQATQGAVTEMETAARSGFCGVTIGTSTPERELDDPELEDFWACAAELTMPVFVHPIRHRTDSRGWTGVLSNTVGRLRESLLALARLLLAGVPSRHPELRLVIAHGGAGPETLLARLKRHHTFAEDSGADPMTAFLALYFDSVVIEPRLLTSLVDLAGAERVLLGSDYPFQWEPAPRATVEAAGLDRSSEVAILSKNARELFGRRFATWQGVRAQA